MVHVIILKYYLKLDDVPVMLDNFL